LHTLDNFGPAFAIGTALNVDFVIDETIFGLRANSVALLADARHNLSDVLRLLTAWDASILAFPRTDVQAHLWPPQQLDPGRPRQRDRPARRTRRRGLGSSRPHVATTAAMAT